MYDSIDIEEAEKPKVLRGLSKLYKDEYNKTKLEKCNQQYSGIGNYFEKLNCKEQDKCIKHMLFMTAKAKQLTIFPYSVIILFFVTIQNDKNLYTCTKEILKYRIAGLRMKKV